MRSFKGVGRLCTLTLLLVATALSSCGAEECEPGESKELICADETYILRCRSDGTWRVASCNDLRIEQDAIAKKPADLDYDPKNSLAVLDKTTGLIWQRIVELKRRTKADGVSYCEGLEVKDPILGQLSDWRLPSRDELETIVLTTTTAPSIDEEAFPNTPSDPFWTSTKSNDKQGYGVDFKDAGTGYAFFDEKFYIRCVQ